jgi:hypothetical protein
MAATGFMWIEALLLIVATGGNVSLDLASLIDEQSYFKLKTVTVTAETMTELAAKGGTDGRAPMAQLLAIRWLGEHKDEVAKAKAARATLSQLAEGKIGKDVPGFAADYARRALARLDGKPIARPLMPANSLRSDALSWFPERSSIFGGIELRPTREMQKNGTSEEAPFRAALGKMMPPQMQTEMFRFVDTVGNLRIDRVSFAVIPDGNDGGRTRIFIRITGQGDRKALAGYLARQIRGSVLSERKGPEGEPTSVLDCKKDGPGLAFVGDNELLVGFDAGRNAQDKHIDVLEDLLKVAAGKQRSILKGPYANLLKSSPGQALALLIGDIPEGWRGAMTGGRSPIPRLPGKFNLSATIKSKTLTIRFTGAAATANEAKDFVAGVERLKQLASDGLKTLPIKLKPKAIDALQPSLTGIKVEAKDALLSGSASMSRESLNALTDLMQAALTYYLNDEQPKPAKR